MTDQTKVTFWGGLDTIGGNIVSIQYGDYRIITDFGALAGVNIMDLLSKETTQSHLKLGQLPAIEGLYPKTAIGDFALESFEDSTINTIVCLSHLHLDHLGAFGQLPEELPVYALEEAVEFYQQLESTRLLPSYVVNWQTVKAEQVLQHGPFDIVFYESDHDTVGAASLFIKTPDFKIVYSGDFRLSGFHPEKVLNWAQKVREFEADLFLVEGTTFSHSASEPNPVDVSLGEITHSINSPNEMKLMNSIEEIAQTHSSQLITFNGYPQNIERLLILAELFTTLGRTLVMDQTYFELMSPYLTGYLNVKYLSLDEQTASSDAVTLEQLREAPQHYVLQFDYERHDHVFSLPAGVYFHSNGMPLGSFMPEYEPYVRRFVEAGWEFYHANVSGHASQSDLLLVNYLAQPKLVVPWHTFKPDVYGEALEGIGLQTWLPEYHVEYTAEEIADLIK